MEENTMKLKKSFGRMHLENPKRVSRLTTLSLVLISICLLYALGLSIFRAAKPDAVDMTDPGRVILSILILFVPFLVFLKLFALSYNAHLYAEKLPEYWLTEAEDILEKYGNNAPWFLVLESLVSKIKLEKTEGNIKSLRDCLEKVKEYESLNKDREDLEKEIKLLKDKQSQLRSKLKQ